MASLDKVAVEFVLGAYTSGTAFTACDNAFAVRAGLLDAEATARATTVRADAANVVVIGDAIVSRTHVKTLPCYVAAWIAQPRPAVTYD